MNATYQSIQVDVDLPSQKGSIRQKKNLLANKTITPSEMAIRRPATAGGQRRKIVKGVHVKASLGEASNAMLMSQNLMSGTTHSGSNKGVIRIPSESTGFGTRPQEVISRGGSRTKISGDVTRLSSMFKSMTRPKSSIGPLGRRSSASGFNSR